MKPADQLKVIALAFLAIVAMIGIITAVSLKTTEAVAGHHAAGAHGESAGEHGDASAEHDVPKTNVDSMAQDQTHSDAGHAANQAGHADGGSKDMPGDQGLHQPADDKSAEHASEGKMAEHGDAAKPAEHAADAKSGEHAADAKSAEHAAPAEHAAAPAGGNVEAGAKVFMAKTCATCHTVTAVKATGTIGPKLDGLSKTAATRKPGTAADAYIKESIENPTAFVVPNFQPMMPALRSTMSDQEFKDLVAFLGSL